MARDDPGRRPRDADPRWTPPAGSAAHAARHQFLEESGRRDLSEKLAVPIRDVMNAILDEAAQFVATFRAGV